ncbi:MAG: ABC transporter permease subunit [bacterium]|nr:ABC transporter permease subunit [bacterium]MDT8365676.1 ABC transporter permease subunit [bacterium]
MSDRVKFSGRKRKKETPWTVKAGDVLSKWIITVGGIGTVVAISTVFFLLLWVVLPLLRPASVGSEQNFRPPYEQIRPLHTQADEYRTMLFSLLPDGRIIALGLDNGAILEERQIFPDRKITAASFSLTSSDTILGFENGEVVFGKVTFETGFLDLDEVDDTVRSFSTEEIGRIGNAMVQRISRDQFRTQRLTVSFSEPVPGDSDTPVMLVDQITDGADRVYVVFHEDRTFSLVRAEERENMLTGELTFSTESASLPFIAADRKDLPAFLTLAGLGDSASVAWPDGTLVRYNTRDFDRPYVQEVVDLVEDPDETLTVLRFLLGRTTLLTGDSAGTVRAWFPARTSSTVPGSDEDHLRLVTAHEFKGDSPVTAIASSSRMRMIGVGREDGSADIFHVTSHKRLGALKPSTARGPVLSMMFAPRDDAVLAGYRDTMARWDLDPRHPETTFGSLLLPVWYEGASVPEHVWQSSAATDDFEPKFGLIPLIFGTLKATLYSLLFGVPIALMAAVFTSEFLTPRIRSRVKPVVELMASLPSVVLGFLAALVFAPVVADLLTVFMAVFVTMPLSFLLGAYLWQLLPHGWSIRMQSFRFWFIFLPVPLGMGLAMVLAPGLETICFGGDVISWLDGQLPGTWGAWTFLMLPVTALAAAWLSGVKVSLWVRRLTADWSRTRCAWFDLSRFGLTALAILAGSGILGGILSLLGLDPRGGVFGTYVQRNSLIVGFVMGFAIIPIIYTISEDALSAVPDHLRSASLGAGATPWQTATRIIIPTAMSGLFSAIMIGLGRAVGETMIVLMAAGNTPIMDMNIFNGFRTLSANIAVELPEAVVNSTHYRTLFLAALVLFLMTFVLNTFAEIVRLRFRKRASEL